MEEVIVHVLISLPPPPLPPPPGCSAQCLSCVLMDLYIYILFLVKQTKLKTKLSFLHPNMSLAS